MRKSIVLVAKDMAPSQILSLIEKVLTQDNGITVNAFLASGKEFSNDLETILDFASDARAVVVGMSSSKELAEEEIAVAKEALEIGTPVFCYADTFGLRPHFDEVLSHRLTTLFCINEKQAEQAREKYPDLKVVVTGNPAWEQFFFPKLTREQSRDKLGIGLDETVVLCPGGKDAVVNTLHFSAAIESYAGDKVCHVIISLHPGDKTLPSVYQSLVDFAPDNVKVRIIPASEMSASDILSGADCVISSASTIEVEALCRDVPIPVFSYLSPLAKRRLKKATGSEEWELVKMEVVYEYDHVTRLNLLDSIKDWMSYGEDSMQVKKIRKHFPKPEKLGTAIDKMVDAILN